MNETTTTTAPAAAATAPAAKAKKVPAKKAARKAAPAKKASAAGPATGTLTKPQVRLLAALAKSGRPMSAEQLSEKASVARTWVTGFVFKACAANRTPALVEQRFARPVEVQLDGRTERLYEVTAAGRKALARAAG